MITKSETTPTIGLIEVPATGLYDAEGKNWTSLYRHRSLISKQVLIPDLQAGGWLFSPLCDNFCLWNREMLTGQDF